MQVAKLKLLTGRDVVTAREVVRRKAQEIGFGLAKQTRLATAVSEIVRNAVVHGLGGEMIVERLQKNSPILRVTIRDQGPGIADIDKALQDGYSTTGTLGAGLPGARRLVDDFKIESAVGQGTTVIMEMR
ncbi:MAG: anti-sigma regulatory factor [Chloroflexi bacterium]|nr:anti-sigma regulatory factor [Chloroflexota bacterium]